MNSYFLRRRVIGRGAGLPCLRLIPPRSLFSEDPSCTSHVKVDDLKSWGVEIRAAPESAAVSLSTVSRPASPDIRFLVKDFVDDLKGGSPKIYVSFVVSY